MMWALAAIVLVLGAFLAGWLEAFRPEKPAPFLTRSGKPPVGSISEKNSIPINGVAQGMFIKGKDITKPALLFLHGGPGMPEYTFSWQFPAVLEDDFIVCYWEQRGSGLSYHPDMPGESITAEQLIADTLAVTEYLRQRFGQEKIYLMGHSWGTFLGIQAAARAPELYRAYLGMAQLSRQLESEKLAYRYMVERYTAAGDTKMVKRLAKFPLTEMDGFPNAYRGLREEAMHRLGIGTTHVMKSVVTGIFLAALQNREYTFGERINVWRGKWSAHSTRLWNEMLATDVTEKVRRLEMPVYFFHGIYDYTICYALAREYFARLEAPVKGFYTFEHSAHSPLFEEPEKMQRILREDVLAGGNGLADVR